MAQKNVTIQKKLSVFLKERGIQIHFRDLTEKGLSPGELQNITAKIDINELIDTESKQYKKRGMQFMVFNIEEELLEDPLLLKTPIVRFGREATVGYEPEIWKSWE